MPATKPRPTAEVDRVKRLPHPPGKPGRKPGVLTGFYINPPPGRRGHRKTRRIGPGWDKGSTAAIVLDRLAVGGTWEHAAEFALVHESTPRAWNARGRDAIGEETIETLAADPDVDEETFACAVFYVLARAARASVPLGYLDSIARAADDGEWRAAVAGLRAIPQAAPYRETTRIEHTGADGAALVPDSTRIMLELAEQYATEQTDSDDPAALPAGDQPDD